ncbi:hypothetical protein JOD54_001200 [Actinokineospora baliensis]|uniref:hypothetical protein n=1 Tax=Actinokineospora baliensis TaxID=547056 RepID=UPI00195B5312|nr:hypothetical protein [Actinokineospora baliensis]MBM7770996.1 hypothetical protein [Actinokineospora baliensis]
MRETTALRRAVSRTLVVLGGTLASTAAAWAICTATAGADVATDLQHDLRSVVDAVPALDAPAAAEVKSGLLGLTDSLGTLVGEPVDASRVTEVSHGATQAVEEFGRDLAKQLPSHLGTARVDLPLRGAVTRPAEVTPAPEQTAQFPVLGSPFVEQATPAATAEALLPTALATRPVPGAHERATGNGLSQRGSPESADERVNQHAPALPTGPSPLAPLSMPAPVSPGHPGAGAADALGHGLVVVTPADSDPASASAPRSTPVAASTTVDAQPGVTPD